MSCTIMDCGRMRHAKGLCKRHYQQEWRTGNPAIVRPNPHGSPEERFWRYVELGGLNDCWEWQGRRDKDGYGTLRVGRTQVRAHRFSYELHNGSLSDGQRLRHRCDNPPCVNPEHLIPGDHRANMADRLAAGHYGHWRRKVSTEGAA